MILLAVCTLAALPAAVALSAEPGVPTSGLLVHLNCGTGEQTLQLGKSGTFLVHGLEKDAGKVLRAQKLLHSTDLYGQFSAEQWIGTSLPYSDNLVNLLIVDSADAGLRREIMRVLCPGGVAKIGREVVQKPWPKELDGWTHLRHGPDGNPVSGDLAVSLPRRIQWISAASRGQMPLLSANGRNFYGGVVARDSFNGLPIWRTRGFVCKVATEKALYGISNGSVVSIDAAGGKPVGQFGSVDRDAELLLTGDVLIVVGGGEVRAQAVGQSGPRWSVRANNPKCVVAAEKRVFFIEGNPRRGGACSAVCLDLAGGKQLWRSEEYPWLAKVSGCSYGAGALAYEECSFNNDPPGNGLHVLLAADGKFLWSHSFTPGMSHNKQARAMFLGQQLWVQSEGFTQLDLRTGREVRRIPGGKGHCYSPMATVRFLVGGELNFSEVDTGKQERNAITKGECGMGSEFPGWIPAQGLLYTYKGCRSHCICYPMVEGCMGLAPEATAAAHPAGSGGEGFVQGPAWPARTTPTPKDQAAAEWPAYRCDPWRSGGTAAAVAGKLRRLWAARTVQPGKSTLADEWRGNPFVTGPVTAPVVAGGTVLVALPDAHEVVALDAGSGKVRWSFVANGRVDTPPTVHDGLCLFGTRAGWVYCLDLADGAMVWRRAAGAEDRRIVAWGQLESAWPAIGSVMVHKGAAFVVAGRDALADGGIQVCALRPDSGGVMWRAAITDYGIKGWYSRVGYDYDPVDIPVMDGQDVLAVSRARVAGSRVEVNRDSGSFYRNAAGAYVPMGTWAYGTAINRSAQKRPLWVFDDRSLYGPPPHHGAVGDQGGNVDSGINAYTLPQTPPKTGQREWGPYDELDRLGKKWSANVGKIVAMVRADDKLFVADGDGKLHVFAAADGKKIDESAIGGKCVWDGLAAAYGRLYVSLADGGVACLGDASAAGPIPAAPTAGKR
jgi:outer membrane protein assembly factor BamB